MTPAIATYSQLRLAYEDAIQLIRRRRPELQRATLDAELHQLASVTVHGLQHWADRAAACAQAGEPLPWEVGGRVGVGRSILSPVPRSPGG